MSSYYFSDDTDAGPPSDEPDGGDDWCGHGWVCEHRWSSIMNLVRFANVCQGEPIDNWQIFGYSLGFSRGDKVNWKIK